MKVNARRDQTSTSLFLLLRPERKQKNCSCVGSNSDKCLVWDVTRKVMKTKLSRKKAIPRLLCIILKLYFSVGWRGKPSLWSVFSHLPLYNNENQDFRGIKNLWDILIYITGSWKAFWNNRYHAFMPLKSYTGHLWLGCVPMVHQKQRENT